MEIIDENKNNPDSNQDKNTNSSTPEYNKWEEHHERNKLLAGLIVVGIGCLFLAREMGAYIPHWIFSWPMLLIVIGIYSGVKNQFQNSTWFILILVGSAFLVRRFLPEFNLAHYTWPVIIIIIGIFIMTKPGNMFRSSRRNYYRGSTGQSSQHNQTETVTADMRPPGPMTLNSIGDQYFGRGGFSYLVWPAKGLTLSLGGRIEGVPVYDAIGDSLGFRQPGYTVSVEPGISWMGKKNTLSILAPVAVYRNRERSASEIAMRRPGGDASFADFSILTTFTHHF